MEAEGARVEKEKAQMLSVCGRLIPFLRTLNILRASKCGTDCCLESRVHSGDHLSSILQPHSSGPSIIRISIPNLKWHKGLKNSHIKMRSNNDCSDQPNQPLGLLLCFIVIAYIYYFTPSQPQPPKFLEQQQNEEAISPLRAETQLGDTVVGEPLTSNARHLKAYIQFDIQEIRNIKSHVDEWSHQSREREKRIQKRFDEFTRSREEMEGLMKEWREEQLRMIWSGKQRGEGLARWFKFGSSRTTELARRDDGLNWDVVNKVVTEKSDEKKG